jgi:hypothetical protein
VAAKNIRRIKNKSIDLFMITSGCCIVTYSEKFFFLGFIILIKPTGFQRLFSLTSIFIIWTSKYIEMNVTAGGHSCNPKNRQKIIEEFLINRL